MLWIWRRCQPMARAASFAVNMVVWRKVVRFQQLVLATMPVLRQRQHAERRHLMPSHME
jgi:hypothetical protein